LDPASFEVVTLPSGKRQLKAIAQSSGAQRVYDETAAVDTSDPDGQTFKIPAPGNRLVVLIDGIRKFAGPDYQILDATTFRFVGAWGNQAGNRITVDYDPL
jgi:hypothetical protein